MYSPFTKITYILSSPHYLLKQFLRAIWGAVSQATVFILAQIKLNLQLLCRAIFFKSTGTSIRSHSKLAEESRPKFLLEHCHIWMAILANSARTSGDEDKLNVQDWGNGDNESGKSRGHTSVYIFWMCLFNQHVWIPFYLKHNPTSEEQSVLQILRTSNFTSQ